MNKIKKNVLPCIGLLLSILAFKKIYNTLKKEVERGKLKNSVVIITGASEGIGKELAIEFAKQGSKIILASRNIEKLKKVEKELLENYNCEVISVVTDVSRNTDCINLIETALDKFSKIDILINNAGIATYDYFHNTSNEEIEKVMAINYFGIVYCTKAVLPYMMKNKKGKIVNISSVLGKIGMPAMSIYSSSKFAMEGLSEALRGELRKYGINITVICPTTTKTEIINNSLSKNIKPKFNKGMSVNRVAKETIDAMLENKKEHVLGLPEKLFLFSNKFIPSFYDYVLSFAPKFILKD